ncbi:MAG: glycosyltransferase family 4 protein [Chitinophagales bacterium]
MKILQICHKPPFPPIDGGCKAMHQVTETLMEQNINVQVLAIETFKHPVDENLQTEAYRKNTNFDSHFVDIKVRPLEALLNLFSSESYNISRFWNSDFAQLIEQKLINEKFDIIQLESLYVAPYLKLIRRHSKAKIVYRAHNLEHKIWETNYEITSNPFKKLYIKLLAKRLKKFETAFIKKVDFIAAISPVDAEWISNNSSVPTKVIPFGLEADLPTDKKAQKNICYLGALDWYPNQLGLEWFLKNVWAEIHQQFPDAQFNIAGRGAPQSILNWDFPGVNIIGEVENTQEFLKQHAIMLVPLFAGSGIRIKILEGLANHLAILTTSLGAEGLDLKDKEHLLLADTALEFKKNLRDLLENKDLQNSLADKGFKRFQQLYSIANIKKQWINFYQSIL